MQAVNGSTSIIGVISKRFKMKISKIVERLKSFSITDITATSSGAEGNWNSDIRIKRETVAAEKILRNLVKIFRLRLPQCI
jgi:hypothetical protein